jgi:hypothetical protein
MPSEPRARAIGKLSVAALGLAGLALLSGCVDGPSRPTLPTYSGNARPDPTRPPRPGDPQPEVTFANPFSQRNDAYVPRHLAGVEARSLKRIAVLLPFNSPDAATRTEARGLFNAIQLSLFDSQQNDVVLIPRDASSSDPQVVADAAQDAARDGAIAVIGPLFASHVGPVAQRARQVSAPVFAFSTDASALNQGAYLVSMPPAAEIDRIVDWASAQGVSRFAMLGPSSANGRAVEAALRAAAARHSALVVSVEYYNPTDANPVEAVRRSADAVKRENAASPGKVAILIPERGVQLRTVAPLLLSMNVDTRQIRLLGTGAWNDPEVWREPALYGGSFPAPDPQSVANFDRRYRAVFGEAPSRFASFGYDAGALVSALAKVGQLDPTTLQRRQGFMGSNGLFRFGADGAPERALAIMTIQPQGAGPRVAQQPLATFGPGS